MMFTNSDTETDTEISPRDILVNCLTQQLSEYELLQSMYPENGDIVLSEPKILKDMENFINGSEGHVPPHLDFILKVIIDNIKLEICINLPSYYPDEEPDIYVRCNKLNRYQESNLNSELSSYLSDNFLGDVCIYSAVSWLHDNLMNFMNEDVKKVSDNNDDEIVNEGKFVRFWIHSHHIYNKKKREDILSKAKDYALTGFCLPGKPGIICIEGSDRSCREWWKIIKSLSWKKIIIKKIDIFESDERIKQQKFDDFKEIHLPRRSQPKQPKHIKHVDMSEFSKFMEQKGLMHIFNEIFGFNKDS